MSERLCVHTIQAKHKNPHDSGHHDLLDDDYPVSKQEDVFLKNSRATKFSIALYPLQVCGGNYECGMNSVPIYTA